GLGDRGSRGLRERREERFALAQLIDGPALPLPDGWLHHQADGGLLEDRARRQLERRRALSSAAGLALAVKRASASVGAPNPRAATLRLCAATDRHARLGRGRL